MSKRDYEIAVYQEEVGAWGTKIADQLRTAFPDVRGEMRTAMMAAALATAAGVLDGYSIDEPKPEGKRDGVTGALARCTQDWL